MTTNLEPQTYDVAIVGSGMAGSSLATILARHGLSVLVFEAKSHPRFSIGESMILETSETMRAMAELYDVPELAYFSSENYLPMIGTSHGVKRHFSYLHHSKGETPDASKALQAVIPKEPHGHELHIYRQDSDAFFVNTAISYGATVLQHTPVDALELGEDGVHIQAAQATYHANYLVDAGGFNSIIAKQLELRDFDLKTHSRAIFTHMVDLKTVHETSVDRRTLGIPFDMSEGTLHHVFEGGWLWVIPFDNHAKSTNPLCSVGLMLDPRTYPKRDDISADEEFFDFIERFPGIKAQFEGAKAVRPWTRTGRIQYSSKEIVGDRWALLGHAAGFVDPLFSKGLYISLTSVSLLAHLLLGAQTTKDFSREAFIGLEEKTHAYLKTNDQLVASAYKSFAHHQLWHSYSVVWLLGAYTEFVKLMSVRAASHSRAAYFEASQGLALAGGGFEAFRELTQNIDSLIDRLDLSDEKACAQTLSQVTALLSALEWMPKGFHDVLNGKNHLPKRKLRLGLLRAQRGFMGGGAYRAHFFGGLSTPELLISFIREKTNYAPSRVGKKRFRWFGSV